MRPKDGKYVNSLSRPPTTIYLFIGRSWCACQTLAAVQATFPQTKAVFVKTDVSKESDCKAMVDAGEKNFGRVNVLFNNAGVMLNDDDNAMTTPESTWDRTFAVNVKGVWFGCKYVACTSLL
jgi:NAD(P)-dependent dehydrogenase (short-subunit alcohol dehydrogenase family)